MDNHVTAQEMFVYTAKQSGKIAQTRPYAFGRMGGVNHLQTNLLARMANDVEDGRTIIGIRPLAAPFVGSPMGGGSAD